MDNFPGYSILEKIAQTNHSIVYRARKENEGKTCILKEIRSSNPTASDIARFKQEYNFIKDANIPGIVGVHEIITEKDHISLVVEDFSATSLKSIIKNATLSIKPFLQMGITLADILGSLHAKNIVHRDIKPHNILVNLEKDIVKITDFGIAQTITHENDEIYNRDVIEGTLVYMSPEQTGRMNRTTDYRTDLYSLGMTFYEMLTGAVPFGSDDPIEIIHAHIAKAPEPPHKVDQTIPEIISDIIMKLLEKNPEDRYQSCQGLKADLEQCLALLKKEGSISAFALQRKDITVNFSMQQKIFGRDGEIALLMQSFTNAAHGQSEVVMVSGSPGIGKSSLINELHEPIIKSGGYFLKGKYEQFGKNIPYSSIIQAFHGLVRQILIEKEEAIAQWRSKISTALGENGGVITNVIPEVELIIGPQPPVPDMAPEQAQNMFINAFKNFIQIFATADHPLTLFLDDMQWADNASLNFLKTVITDSDVRYIFFIGSYRTQDVDETHPLYQVIQELKNTGVILTNVEVLPLEEHSVKEIIMHLLRCEETDCGPLAAEVYRKTSGNPFFVHQFLKSLYDEGLLKVDTGKGWGWDLEKVKARHVTDNVAELMAEKITGLPEETQEMLKICSCIGNRFDIETIAAVAGISIDESLKRLTMAVNQGLIYENDGLYRFYHDRIHQAAYSQIPDEKKASLHYAAGTYTLAKTAVDTLPNRVLYIADQLNAGQKCLTSDAERIRAAELNLMAGHKAKSAAAYHSSLEYLHNGIAYLDKKSWKNNYTLSLALYTEAAESAYLDTNFDEMERLASVVLKSARTTLDEIKIHETKIRTLMAQHRLVESIHLALDVLKKLKIRLPEYPSMGRVGLGLIRTKIALIGRSLDELLNLPTCQDPVLLAGFRILSSIASVAYYARPNLIPLIPFLTVQQSIKKGNAPESTFSYVVYGMLLCSLGQINMGYEYGKMALQLLHNLGARELYPRINFAWNCFVRHWKEHVNTCLDPLIVAHNKSLEVGDTEYAGHTAMAYSYSIFVTGDQLGHILSEVEHYDASITKLKQETPLNLIKMTHQITKNLMGLNENPLLLQGDIYQEDVMLPSHIEEGDHTSAAVYYLYKMVLCYLFSDYEEGLKNTEKCEKELKALLATALFGLVNFYGSLIRLALCGSSGFFRRKLMIRVALNQKLMKIWAKHAPMNYLHKFQVIEAERARIKGDYCKAMELYDKAIDNAHDSGYINDEALIYEITARHLVARGQNRSAGVYINAAVRAYRAWGAAAKCKELVDRYGKIIEDHVAKTSADTTMTDTTLNATTMLDFSAIMKGSQALSSEIDLAKLLETMMKLAITHGGAQKGFLILEKEKKLYIEAVGGIDKDVEVLTSIPLEKSMELSAGIVQYVYRDQKPVILDNAVNDSMFMNDPYVRNNKPKSILCAPISKKGNDAVIIYLENNLSSSTFTAERLKLLRVLTSQAAISIENARLLVHRENSARLSREMEIAENIQTALLPPEPAITGYEVAAFMKPADEVGGDYYDVINVEGRDWIVIGDVSGHGLHSGLIMMMAQTSIRTVLTQNPEIKPHLLLEIINSVLSHNIMALNQHKYMTITVLACHDKGQLYFAGLHQDIMVYRKKTSKVERIGTDGMWLGLDIKISNDIHSLQLDTGDVLLLYTDGVTEAWKKESVKNERNPEQEMFGDERLYEIFAEQGKAPATDIIQTVVHALEPYDTVDDVTLVVIRKL